MSWDKNSHKQDRPDTSERKTNNNTLPKYLKIELS